MTNLPYTVLYDDQGAIVRAKERSTLAVDLTFRDEDGSAVAPSSATWTLTDTSGTVINSRSAVSIASPESAETIVLSGADLANTSSVPVQRVLTIEAVYSSDLGSNLPLKQEIRFLVDPLVAVS